MSALSFKCSAQNKSSKPEVDHQIPICTSTSSYRQLCIELRRQTYPETRFEVLVGERELVLCIVFMD